MNRRSGAHGASRRRAAAAAAVAALLGTALHATTASAAPAPPRPPSDARLAQQPARDDATREQYYFVLPDRFANGDTSNDKGGLTGSRSSTGYDPTDKGFYQGGDLKGLTKKLDYIKGLGTTAIWMAPIFKNKPVQGSGSSESAGYHGYWITDFTQVDPHFGTNQDLAALIDKAHAKGMKVYFDVITNHTADVVTDTEQTHGYRSKGAYPYLDSEGRPFDDTTDPTRKVDADSFPYTPTTTAAEKDIKSPSWLNDPTMYHNRGDSTFVGESGLYGDHTGLDDLWTERPEVVEGMERIYEKWVKDFGIDGFRVDTVRNVDMKFWTQWATALDAYAARHGRDDFFIFGETLSADPSVTAPYVTQGRLDATLDFPLQDAIRGYASQGKSATGLSDVLAQDYRYTTDKANAYNEVTFLGNHDMGRIGAFLESDNPKASDAELLRRDQLANELMFFTRGNPVIYSGDEQGFTGAGGDKDARQTMFASKVADYLDDDEIGTDRTHADDSYDTAHPLYKAIAALSKLRKQNPALADGVQKELYAKDSVYAFSRTGDDREYVVAVNNATERKTVELPVESAKFASLYGGSGAVSADGGTIKVTVPALSSLVLRADGKLSAATGKPTVTLKAPDAGATGTVTVAADPGNTTGARVVFAAQVGNGPWRTLGTADHAPYQVTQTLADSVAAGTALRYKAVVVDRAGRTASALAESAAGQAPAAEKPSAVDRAYAVVHYKRTDGDYDGVTLKSGDSKGEFIGRDAYGAFAWVKVPDGASSLTYTIEKNGTADGAERTVDLAKTGEVWVEQGKDGQETSRPDGVYPPQDKTKAVIHIHRADGDYAGWGLHTWTGAAKETDWTKPLQPTGKDAYGVTFEVPLADGATSLSYIFHKGDEKDISSDRSLDLSTYGHEVWLNAGDSNYLLPSVGSAPDLDVTKAQAQWIDADTVVLPGSVNAKAAASTQLVYSRDGGITVKDGALSDEGRWLRLLPAQLTDTQKTKYPHLKEYTAFTVDPRDRDRVRDALAGQTVLTQRLANGALVAATGVQTQGVLDDLYGSKAEQAALGPVFKGNKVTLSVWAPTAQHVALELGGKNLAMRRDDTTGVWSVTGSASAWRGKEYRYAVKVWAPSVQKVVTNEVTDPYSVALTANSERSVVADLDDKSLAPSGWSSLKKPEAVAMKDAQIQELHIRDFSVEDKTTPKDERGTYLAFTDKNSDGSKHLKELAKSGTSYVHLLPAFDIATIPEKKSEQATPDCDLTSYPADSDKQQECVAAAAAKDAYNWGYDPYHYTVPEGSYATDPDGTARTVQFRKMVKSLNDDGLRVVMDVVYNHTTSSGQSKTSVLDKIVPGYYQRLLADGSVANSTCCSNTAPENTMMGKLVVDSIVTWAKEYKVDGFRFDLMGHHPKANILAVRKALDALTPAKDGVDGKKIILYGEGWNFGEVADDARFVQATQKNMAGTGIATFNDRARDAVRGGSPFDSDPGVQGFASGLYTDPNSSDANGSPAEQKARLLHYQDLIKVGLSGNLAGYTFTDTEGKQVKGSDVDYNGAAAGYADAPGDALAYADAHDNETLYDALTYKLPASTSTADRSRMQVLALATAALSQGPALSQAGSDLLRSKSLDRNSFDSGDWFNAIHWDCRAGNGFGRGLPPAADNKDKWPFGKPLLTSVAVPDCPAITGTSAAYQDLLKIRTDESAFHLSTTGQVQKALSFPLSGKDETPGVITMRLGDLVVVFNATPKTQEQTVKDTEGAAYHLHPKQANGSDDVVKSASFKASSGTFTVPARTVAVFTR
ncbi:pullulanase-type alpha-1,6-glucosidase [Streptomyces sp. VRA16 Mangrove soil]|uniref:pullulanase-type alpha-1,6-glucosidase n=1 Tax=Streptomyces sp. VRA16 Mangrove soil TaxID=2817434 RepID=UPI001A9CD060|nr:pullulanase-type alpha-1,6-glucosidase [Streptomyces sp. VRA16 Mangrove soil]MBO1334450.1 pullulanase-type alpha-1,6-glucosidase [Streptomyces sp. VRA16 Mangrove soil]